MKCVRSVLPLFLVVVGWCATAVFARPDLHAQNAATTASAQETAAKPVGSKIWICRNAEIEQYIRTAKVVREEDLSVGVTKPKRLFFEPGGPVGSVAFNSLNEQFPRWDSYMADIAAYELDKLLELNMVPPVVEREYKGATGRASMWVEKAKMWNIKTPPTPPNATAWSLQVIDMKMFDILVGNVDSNQGNMLYDPDFNLVLIDHTRAFANGPKLLDAVSFPQHVDRQLWKRMQALTEPQLKAALDRWLPRGLWKDILKRRALMEKTINKMIAEKGEAAVWVR
jgi:hypothetical protein